MNGTGGLALVFLEHIEPHPGELAIRAAYQLMISIAALGGYRSPPGRGTNGNLSRSSRI